MKIISIMTLLISLNSFAAARICEQSIEKLLSGRVVYTNELEDFEDGFYLVSVELKNEAYGGRQVGILVENSDELILLKETNLEADKEWKYYEFIFEKNSRDESGRLILDMQYSSSIKFRRLTIEQI